MLRTNRPFIILGLLAIVVPLGSCDKEPEVADTDFGGIVPVLVEQARKGPFRLERRFTGTVRASVQVTVTVREPGKAAKVSFPKDGEPVAKGQFLMRLHSPELDLSLEEASYRFERAQSDLKLYESLHAQGLKPLLELEQKRTDFEFARIKLASLNLQKELLTIKAPATGVAVNPMTPAVGQYCERGTELLRIVEPESYSVEVTLPMGWTDVMGDVQNAVLELPGGGEADATVLSLSAQVDETRGGRILVLKPGSPSFLYQGAVLPVRLVLVSRDEAVTVPLEALIETPDGDQVRVGPAPGAQDRIVQKKVVRGPDNGERVVIESGMEGGEWVVMGSTGRWGFYRTFLGVGKE